MRKTGSLQDYVKACIDASPAVVQGMAYAAAMKGQKYSAFVKQTYGGNNGRGNSGPTCYSCGEVGHLKKDCKKGQGAGKRPPPGICPRCKKGRHWKSECRSKYDKEGNKIIDKEEEAKN